METGFKYISKSDLEVYQHIEHQPLFLEIAHQLKCIAKELKRINNEEQ